MRRFIKKLLNFKEIDLFSRFLEKKGRFLEKICENFSGF